MKKIKPYLIIFIVIVLIIFGYIIITNLGINNSELNISNKTSIDNANVNSSINNIKINETSQSSNINNLNTEKSDQNFSLDFSVIVLPDTQTYSMNYPEVFNDQTKWIVKNKESLKINMVLGEGDIINNWDILSQWDNANNSYSILDKDKIPYLVVAGNHDSNYKANYSNYNKYFPVSRFKSNPLYKGNFEENKNSYEVLEQNNKDYLFIGLDFCPTDKEIEWANTILAKYENSLAILVTHGFLDNNEPPNREVSGCGSTQYIWDNLTNKYKNLQIILSGHVHSERMRVDNNIAGKPVYQILADYQDDKNSGYLRILEFDIKNKLVKVKTYSPNLNKYKDSDKSEFKLKL